MSLYRYKVVVSGGAEKEGLVTAKTEAQARDRVGEKLGLVEWRSLQTEAEPPQTHPPEPGAPPPTSAAPQPRGLSKLDKLLYLQSGRCFFCGEPLRLEDASIEHLLPLSRGGKRSEDNEVVCHRTLNDTFGNLDLKRKFEFTLKAAGRFRCPNQPLPPERDTEAISG